MAYFNTRRTGDIERRLNGMRQVRQFIVQNGVQALTAVTQLLVALALMVVYSPILALVYLATAPLYAALMRFSAKRLRPMFDSLEESFGKYQSRQIDAIKGIETVKAMGAESSLSKLMLGQFNDLAQPLFRSDYTIMLYEGAIQLVTFLSLALFLCVGALLILDHRLTIGELVAFNALVVLANAPVATVLAVWDQLQYSGILIGRLNDILEHEPEQGEDHTHLKPVPTLEGRIWFHSLSFHYGGPVIILILQEITLEVEPGTTVVDRRTARLRQDHAGQMPRRTHRAHQRLDQLRRNRPAHSRLQVAAAPGRLRPAGKPSVQRHHRAQYRVR
jgi:ATP-binding cassette subfamily B protein